RVMRQGNLRAFYLSISRLASQLPGQFVYLCNTRCARGMTSRHKATTGIDGKTPPQSHFIVCNPCSNVCSLAKTQALVKHEFTGGSGVVHLCQSNVFRTN